jgi:hypothetical protein
MDNLLFLANKAKAQDFSEMLYKDLEKYGIEKVDIPKSLKQSREKELANERRSRDGRRNKKNPNFFVLPMNLNGGKGMGKGFGDLSMLEELIQNAGKMRGSGTDDSEMDSSEENSEFEEEETSDSDDDRSGRNGRRK